MTSVLGITFDCANASVIARFWSEALSGRIGLDASEDAAVLEVWADPGPLRLAFRKVITAVGVELDQKLAALVEHLKVAVPQALLTG